MKPGKKKGFALLLDASDKPPKGPPSSQRPNDGPKAPDMGDDEDDLSDLDDMGGDLDDDLPGDDLDDPMAASGDDGSGDTSGDAGQIDPEVAGLAARLGFHQPHQQQALIDLIQLVTGPGGMSGGSSSSSAPSPLPESSSY